MSHTRAMTSTKTGGCLLLRILPKMWQFFWLGMLLLLLSSHDLPHNAALWRIGLPILPMANAQSCDMEIWVFDTLTRCNDTLPPNALGTIYADGDCHAVSVTESEQASDVDLFPGNYRAICTADNKVRFVDSGCASETCASTSLNSDVTTCDRNAGTTASLYSRLTVPEYIVQAKTEATVGGYYTCLRLQGADESTVTFVVFGDCSQPECQGNTGGGNGGDETTNPPIDETGFPTLSPIAAAPTVDEATPEPTVGDSSTVEPTNSELDVTDAPVAAPTVDEVPAAPTLAPVAAAPFTAAPVSVSPVVGSSPTTAAPLATSTTPAPVAAVDGVPTTLAPVATVPTEEPLESEPTSASPQTGENDSPTVAPDESNPATPSTTSAPVSASSPNGAAPNASPTRPNSSPSANNPASPSQPSDTGLSESITIALLFSPATTDLNSAASVNDFEEQTQNQITEAAEAMDCEVLDMSFVNMEQSLVDSEQRKSRRFLQGSNGSGTSSTGTTLRVQVDVAMRYLSTRDPPPSLAEIFASALDSEQDRVKYLKRFELEPLSSASKVVVPVDGNSGTPAGVNGNGSDGDDTQASSSGSGNLTLFGIGAGAAIAVLVAAGLLVHHKRKRRQSGKGSATGMTKTNEVESPSSYGDHGNEKHGHNGNNASSPQRWTNEIVVDPSADDVSTLGGSVLAGLNLVENNNAQNGEDEPTASVNLDYDYGRSRYRSGDVDDRTRSHMTEGSTSAAPTAFTNYSKLGMNVNSVYADDSSFEQQFAEPDEDEDYHNRSLRKEADNTANDINNRVKPFEVRAPPGKLGMVVDTPHGGVPVVRAIKPDSVLMGRVLIGDRLISVDYQDVTSMTALEVSSLISLKQDQVRLLVFCRLTLPHGGSGAAALTPTNDTTA